MCPGAAPGLIEHRKRTAPQLLWRRQTAPPGRGYPAPPCRARAPAAPGLERCAPVDADHVDVQARDRRHERGALIHVIDEWHARGCAAPRACAAPPAARTRVNSRGASSPAQDSNSMSAWAPAAACAARYAAIASARRSSRRCVVRGLRVEEACGRPRTPSTAGRRRDSTCSVNGAPAKPMSGARARHAGTHQAHRSRARTARRAAGTSAGSASICARVRIGLAHHRPGLERERDSHALQRRHDVAEQDRGIELEAPQRLQRHFRRELGRAGQRARSPRARAARGTRAGSGRPGA